MSEASQAWEEYFDKNTEWLQEADLSETFIDGFEAGQKSEKERICIIIDDELKTAKANKSKTGFTVESILQMAYNIGSRIEGQKGSTGGK
jgi:hypothetical protein